MDFLEICASGIRASGGPPVVLNPKGVHEMPLSVVFALQLKSALQAEENQKEIVPQDLEFVVLSGLNFKNNQSKTLSYTALRSADFEDMFAVFYWVQKTSNHAIFAAMPL